MGGWADGGWRMAGGWADGGWDVLMRPTAKYLAQLGLVKQY